MPLPVPNVATLGTFPACLRQRFQTHPERIALTFRGEANGSTDRDSVLTYGELESRVEELAWRMMTDSDHPIHPGDRALLLFPAGIEFIVAFLACQYCRMIPVPTSFPKPGRAMPRLDTAASDCRPSRLIADSKTLAGIDLQRVGAEVARAKFVASDAIADHTGQRIDFGDRLESVVPDDLALLQYTSGSTSQPKGVMVSHANLMANLESIRLAFGLSDALMTDDEPPAENMVKSVFWLPPFHDMGLIGGILETLYVGGHALLMSPRTFLTRPLEWLDAISKTDAWISGAPNFAYQLCVDRIDQNEAAKLNLAGWKIAFCGAEPIAAETLTRFAEHFAVSRFSTTAFTPCYGLAESTLLAACKPRYTEWKTTLIRRDDLMRGKATEASFKEPLANVKRIVACGPAGEGTTIAIVDPETSRGLPERQVGEVWVQGRSVATGYWGRPDATTERFQAILSDQPDGGRFLRTGDLGYLDAGELYITGRMKDVIILRGRNHYPQDIESSAKESLDGVITQCVAVASVDAESESLAVIAEVSRHSSDDELPDMARVIRRRVIEDHEIDPRVVLLTRPAAIPVTTSGKVQRQAAKHLLETNQPNERYRWSRPSVIDGVLAEQLPPLPQPSDLPPREETRSQIQRWLIAWMIARGGLSHEDVLADTPFSRNGLDSLAAIELSRELEDWLGIVLPIEFATSDPTPADMADYLTDQLIVNRT
ncbi:AMP-binding protein [Neorhodopirellula pilleata]|uniref:Long-chain-fatty-acid--AMP ligase FadD29 n=1 Tax=Neorhodopirellula pilleata TaxID=2714738 RepID=A0A5C6AVG7_9BACT|nr:AMP-binding protein [Neorhodopirellula pilleata]TWU03199.1 Long-chain-fatty-acid--AMP ligase FadD29 [Neorhodopirellula pilleata]